jgi:AcrR family transcriptional regulator
MPYPAQIDRETIIQTARLLIEREGIDHLSLAHLASALGVKAPSLYRHVASKPALLQAVVTVTFQALFQAYAIALSEVGRDPKERLLAILRAHRAFAHAHPRTYVLAFTTTVPEQRADAHLLEQLARPIQEVMAALSGPAHALSALRGALALVHGFVLLELNDQLRRGGDLDAAFEAATNAYITGWLHTDAMHAPSDVRVDPA